MSTPHWNNIFTDLIRGTFPDYWGNFSGTTAIKAGAIGYINPVDGTFTSANANNSDVAKALAAKVRVENQSNSTDNRIGKLNLSSNGVKFIMESASPAGTLNTIPVSATARWDFSKADSISCNCSLSSRHYVEDALEVLKKYQPDLAKIAYDMGKSSDGVNIYPGFGVITEVLKAQSGANLGSISKDSYFSISGEIESLKKFLGVESGLGGSLEYLIHQADVSQRVWPETGVEPSRDTELPILYQFISFDGQRLLVGWTGGDDKLRLTVRNHSTYVIHFTAAWKDGSGKPHTAESTTSSTVDVNFDKIHRDAYDFTLTGEFKGIISNETKEVSWSYPVVDWKQGNGTAYCQGIWPQAPRLSKVRPADWSGEDYFIPMNSLPE